MRKFSSSRGPAATSRPPPTVSCSTACVECRPSRRSNRRDARASGTPHTVHVSAYRQSGWSPARKGGSDVEQEVQHVAVLNHVILAFGAHLARFLGALFALVGDEVVVGDGLGTNEAALEVG